MKSVLVVCIGNICRSPMAQGVLAAAMPDLTVTSAGVEAMVGMPADPMAVRLMGARGIDISAHRARQINRQMCTENDMVLVMDDEQRRDIVQRYPQASGKIFRLGEFIDRDVPDPYRRPEQAFRDALALIDTGAQQWLQRIQKLTQATP